MEYFSLKVPTMYGDHHVLEVRRLLLEIPGVGEVYASSSFQTVEIQYDEARVAPAEIEAVLEKAGYIGDLSLPVETSTVTDGKNGGRPIFRHTAAFSQVGKDIGFTREVPFTGRPLWPCPGFGVIHRTEELKDG